MPGPLNVGLALTQIPLAGCQDAAGPMSERVNFGVGRARTVAKKETVHIHQMEISYEPCCCAELANRDKGSCPSSLNREYSDA